MQNYKDLKVWEKAHLLAVAVYSESKTFPKEETYCLTSQLRRSASSIPANIAEGCGKRSQRDFAHFLNIALGSANESEYFMLLSKDLNYLPLEWYSILEKEVNQVKAVLISLISKVRPVSDLKPIT